MDNRTVVDYLRNVKETRPGDGRWALRVADQGGQQGRESLKARTCNFQSSLLPGGDCRLGDDHRWWARAR